VQSVPDLGVTSNASSQTVGRSVTSRHYYGVQYDLGAHSGEVRGSVTYVGAINATGLTSYVPQNLSYIHQRRRKYCKFEGEMSRIQNSVISGRSECWGGV
jgi:hypothetical protein